MQSKNFFTILQSYDLETEFIEELKSVPYENLEILGLTKINPFSFEKEYFNNHIKDVSIDPNANVDGISPNNFYMEATKPFFKLMTFHKIWKKGNDLYPNFSIKPLLDGYLYFHDSTKGYVPYCVGASCLDIIQNGRPYGEPKSFPPKRSDSYVALCTEFLMDMSQEFAGAVAFTDFLVGLAWFTSKENVSDKYIENRLQSFVHVANNKFRVGGDSPFSNISVNSERVLKEVFSNYIFPDERTIDGFIDEIMRVQKIFVNFMYKGRPEASGLPYKFPVLTANFKKEDLKDQEELGTDFFDFIARKNHKGFININTSPRFAMCCFPKGTLVRTEKGFKDISEINKRDKVLTHKNRYRKVIETNIRKFQGDLIKITPYYHSEFTCTPEHPILTQEGWKEAQFITKEDYITKQSIPKHEESITKLNYPIKGKNKWWFLGYYIAEGSRVSKKFGKEHRAWQVCLSCGRHEVEDVYKRLSQLEIFDGWRKLYKPINIFKVEREFTTELRITSKPLWKFLNGYGRGAKNKKIPSSHLEFFKLNDNARKELIKGYVYGDGHKTKYDIQIKSISKKLLRQIKTLLEYDNIYSILRLSQKKGEYEIQGRKVNCNNQYVLQYSNNPTKLIKTKDYVYVKIRKIERKDFNGNVYNLEIEEDESYTISQGIVHNCRLAIDGFKFNSFGGGGLKLGSFRVININLPKIALKSDYKTHIFYNKLWLYLFQAHRLLTIEREILKEKIEHKFLKFFNLGWYNLDDMFFGTLSFHGLSDAIEYLTDKDIMSQEGQELAHDIITLFLAEADTEKDYNINIEQAPSESATNTMARLNRDCRDFYSNQFVPLEFPIKLTDRIRIEGMFSNRITGGSMCFINLDGEMDEEQSLKLHKYIYENSLINQWCPNFGWCVCNECKNAFIGDFDICSKCGSNKIEYYERVVGYFVNRDKVNSGRKKEMLNRRRYNKPDI